MNKPAISIIVPVYGAEAYIGRCVESIASQTFSDWELLLVDDGSLDCSGKICDEYASKSEGKIRVFHKPNGGVSSARELGVQKARGVYSIHIDPDDWIEPKMLETLYGRATESDCDIVICDFLFDYGKGHKVVSKQDCLDGEDLFYRILQFERHGSLCNKLIRTELYSRYELHFPSWLICWEDMFICCNILIHPCKIAYVGSAFYHYDLYSNPNSMSRVATERTIVGMEKFCRYFEKILPCEKRNWLRKTKEMIVVTAYRCNLYSEKELREEYPEINREFVAGNLNNFNMPIYRGLALVLNGSSLKSARLRQRINEFLLRLWVRLKKIFKLW